MLLIINSSDIKAIHAKNTAGSLEPVCRRVSLRLADSPADDLLIYLTDAQAAQLHAELERFWQLEKPTHAEVVAAYADEHAGEAANPTILSPTGQFVYDLVNETNRATARALGVNPIS